MSYAEGIPAKQTARDPAASFREQALKIINASLEEAKTQHPLDIPAIFQYDRPTLGGTVPVKLYRAVRLLAFREVIGSKISAAILTVSGRSVAQKIGIRSVPELVYTLEDFAVAKTKVREQTDDGMVLVSTECATCSGVPKVGEPLCYFEAGLIAGGLESVLGNSIKVLETKCWGLGDRVCRWEVTRETGPRQDAAASADPLELVMALVGKAASAVDNAIAIREKNRQLREAYNRLRESERLKKDLTDMVVHDMRVPLTAVLGSMESLAESMDPKMAAHESELLNVAISGGNVLLRMINDLLDVSKLEEHKVALKKRPTAVCMLVDQAVDQVKILAGRKKLDLHVNTRPELPEIPMDRDRMVRVLINLLGNAIRHTPPGGLIRIGARLMPDKQTLSISVRDTGVGIPKEYHRKVFDKFVQVEEPKRRSASTGLGLTFCKLVVEAHGGTIWVDSEPEKGSTFTLTLPIAP